MSDWSPEQYERFKRQRSEPFFDLLALVEPRPNMRAVDLGCGTGELTRELKRRLGISDLLGVDTSGAMLEKSAAFVEPGLRFAPQKLEEIIAREAYDLVFSNAALHWVEDHAALWPRLIAALAPGGQLAIQIPANHDQPSFLAAAEVAQEPRFAAALGGYTGHRNVLAPERYARLLYELGLARQKVQVRVYGHELPGVDSIVEWVKGTTLTVYAERLGDGLFSEFLVAYRQRLVAMIGDPRPVFFPFKRILMWACRG